MKKLLMLVTLLIFTLAFGTNGFAIPIEVGDAIQFRDGPGDPASVPEGTGGAFLASSPSSNPTWTPFVTFCLEVNEHLWFDTNFLVAGLSNGAIEGGVAGQDPAGGTFDPLADFSAYLYHQAINDFSPDVYAYVQYAIWYEEDEISDSAWLALDDTEIRDFYNEQLDIFNNSSGWSGLGNVRVINVVSQQRDGSYRQRQDVLVEVSPVPEPTTMLLLGAGLIGLVGVGRMKWFKRG